LRAVRDGDIVARLVRGIAESGALTPASIRPPDPLAIAVTKPAIAARR
jgi:hypothetical protein